VQVLVGLVAHVLVGQVQAPAPTTPTPPGQVLGLVVLVLGLGLVGQVLVVPGLGLGLVVPGLGLGLVVPGLVGQVLVG